MGVIRRLEGRVFGKLTVLKFSGLCKNHRKAKWLCQCSCGNKTTVFGSSLWYSLTRSCGCLRIEAARRSDAAFNKIVWQYRRHAKERGLVFNLTKTVLHELISGKCYYCGVVPSNVMKSSGQNLVYSGIDRKSSEKGYTKSNCVSCCAMCNRMKRRWSVQAFVEQIRKIYKYTRGLSTWNP